MISFTILLIDLFYKVFTNEHLVADVQTLSMLVMVEIMFWVMLFGIYNLIKAYRK